MNIEIVPPYVGIRGALKFFNLGPRKTYSLLATRKIKGKKDGKSWYISSASIFKYLNKDCNIREEENNV